MFDTFSTFTPAIHKSSTQPKHSTAKAMGHNHTSQAMRSITRRVKGNDDDSALWCGQIITHFANSWRATENLIKKKMIFVGQWDSIYTIFIWSVLPSLNSIMQWHFINFFLHSTSFVFKLCFRRSISTIWSLLPYPLQLLAIFDILSS